MSEGKFHVKSNVPLQQLVSSIYETVNKLINLKKQGREHIPFVSTLYDS
jgi:hypothetical protein